MADVALRGLTKRYGAQTAVDGIDLDIGDGELVCLLGPSGCGKTTTLRLVAGFIEPSQGAIDVGGRRVSAPGGTLPPEKRNMSMIFQSYALWPHMTVAENVAYGLSVRGMERGAAAAKVRAMLDTVHLGAFADRYPAELSGGQQQRAALARALVVEPQTLLLDEPLSNLDAALREEMRFELRRLHDDTRFTTIYVTHDQIEAMTAADRIVVMNGGRIEQVDAPQAIYEKPRTEFVARFLGGANILSGEAVAPDALVVAGRRIAVAEPALRPGTRGMIAIRHHEIRLCPPGEAPPESGCLAATVTRRTFLGPVMDLSVRLDDATVLRVTAPPQTWLPADGRIEIELPAARCRPLAG